jgi:hypothetical protein
MPATTTITPPRAPMVGSVKLCVRARRLFARGSMDH